MKKVEKLKFGILQELNCIFWAIETNDNKKLKRIVNKKIKDGVYYSGNTSLASKIKEFYDLMKEENNVD